VQTTRTGEVNTRPESSLTPFQANGRVLWRAPQRTTEKAPHGRPGTPPPHHHTPSGLSHAVHQVVIHAAYGARQTVFPLFKNTRDAPVLLSATSSARRWPAESYNVMYGLSPRTFNCAPPSLSPRKTRYGSPTRTPSSTLPLPGAPYKAKRGLCSDSSLSKSNTNLALPVESSTSNRLALSTSGICAAAPLSGTGQIRAALRTTKPSAKPQLAP